MDLEKLKRLHDQSQEQAEQAQSRANNAVSRSVYRRVVTDVYSRVASRALASVSNSISDYYRRVSPSINALVRKALETVTDAIAFYPVLVAERVHLFWRGGWAHAAHIRLGTGELNLGELQSLLAELKEEPDEVVKDALDDRVPAYFREDDYSRLRQMVQKWQNVPAFSDRGVVFGEAIEAHTQGRYTTVVHLLVPHVEGVFREITGVTSTNGRRWLGKVDKALGFKRAKGGRWLSDPARAVEEFRQLDKHRRFEEMWRLDTEAALMSFDELYEKNGLDNSYRDRLAHGQIQDCSEADSIRIFCLLDQLDRVTSLYFRRAQHSLTR
jgi:hypothetical protein